MVESKSWDALAPDWDLLEHLGMAPELVQQVVHLCESPTLVVGARQGLLAAALREAGVAVAAVDSAPEMARRAWERRHLVTAVADAWHLPFSDCLFHAVIVPPGILAHLERAQAVAALQEARRVLAPEGILAAHLPVDHAGLAPLATAGVYHDQVLDYDRIYRLWGKQHDPDAMASMAADWAKVPPAEAAAAINAGSAVLGRCFAQADQLAQRLRRRGQAPEGFIFVRLAGKVPVWNIGAVYALMAAAGTPNPEVVTDPSWPGAWIVVRGAGLLDRPMGGGHRRGPAELEP